MLIFTFNFCKSNVSRSTYSLQWCICPNFFSHDWTFYITFFTKDASFFWPKVTFFTNYPIFFLRKPNCLFIFDVRVVLTLSLTTPWGVDANLLHYLQKNNLWLYTANFVVKVQWNNSEMIASSFDDSSPLHVVFHCTKLKCNNCNFYCEYM